MSKAECESNGVFDELVRVSEGIEDTDDLIKDIEQALEKVTNEVWVIDIISRRV